MSDDFGSALELLREYAEIEGELADPAVHGDPARARQLGRRYAQLGPCLLYTSPSPRDRTRSRMPSSA